MLTLSKRKKLLNYSKASGLPAYYGDTLIAMLTFWWKQKNE